MSCTANDITAWLREIRMREVEGRRVLNTQQYRVVARVAHRVCDEMSAVVKGKFKILVSLYDGACTEVLALERHI